MPASNTHLWSYGIRAAFYLLFGWGAIYWRRWRKSRNEQITQSWPTVQGVILGGQVSAVPKTTRFQATLSYSYFVEEYRAGKYTHEFQKEAEGDDFVRQLKDKRVQIRYQHSNPNRSVLEQSVVEQLVLLAPRFG
jgi:hypothetical protein